MLAAAILIFAHCSLCQSFSHGERRTPSGIAPEEWGACDGSLHTPEHGIPYVREAIRAGKSAREIRSMWRRDVESFIEKSKPYLLYERKER